MQPVWVVVTILGVVAIGGGAYLLYSQATAQRSRLDSLARSQMTAGERTGSDLSKVAEAFGRGAQEGAVGGPWGSIIDAIAQGAGTAVPLLTQGEKSGDVKAMR